MCFEYSEAISLNPKLIKKNGSHTTLALLFLLSCICCTSCFYFTTSSVEHDEPVARVQDKYLYLSDLENLVGKSISSADSTDFTRHFIESWVRRNLMLLKADELLPAAAGADIDKKLEDYRESLVIFILEQELLKQQLDSMITEKEIKDYYQENKSSFTLKDNLLKARYVIQRKEALQSVDSLEKWLKTDSGNDVRKLRTFCETGCTTHSLESSWFYLSNLRQKIPLKIEKPERFLRQNSYYQTSDDRYTYFLKIDDYALAGELAPLEYKKQDITKVIVNKRRLGLIKEIKDQIYKEGLERKTFEIYQE